MKTIIFLDHIARMRIGSTLELNFGNSTTIFIDRIAMHSFYISKNNNQGIYGNQLDILNKFLEFKKEHNL